MGRLQLLTRTTQQLNGSIDYQMCFFGFDDWFARHVSDNGYGQPVSITQYTLFYETTKDTPSKEKHAHMFSWRTGCLEDYVPFGDRFQLFGALHCKLNHHRFTGNATEALQINWNQLSPDHPDHSMFYWWFLHRSMAQDSTPLVVLWRPGCRCGGCSH